MAELRIEISDTTSPTVVVLNGDIELSNALGLRNKLNAIAASGVTDVVIDLRGASFLDGTGLGVLLGAVDRMSKRGQVVLRSAPEDVRRIVDLTTLAPSVMVEDPRPGEEGGGPGPEAH